MKITLYGIPLSGFVAKARIVLDLKGLAHEELPPPGGYGSVDYRAIVPAGSVPGLVVDGVALHDSNAIIEFLEEVAPEPALMPADPLDRARVRALLGYHDTRLEASARALYPLVKRDWRAEPEAVAAGVAGMVSALERLEDLVDPDPYALGGTVTLADIAYPCTLQMMEMLGRELAHPIHLSPKIDAWRRATGALPAVARSQEMARDAMEDWLAQFRH